MKHLRQFLMPMLLCLLALAGALSASALQAGVVTIQSGAVRVELLSDTVIRVEEKVNGGFEDRTTLVAVGRDDFHGILRPERREISGQHVRLVIADHTEIGSLESLERPKNHRAVVDRNQTFGTVAGETFQPRSFAAGLNNDVHELLLIVLIYLGGHEIVDVHQAHDGVVFVHYDQLIDLKLADQAHRVES